MISLTCYTCFLPFAIQRYFLFAVEPTVVTISCNRSPLSDQFSKIPKVFKSNHWILKPLLSDHDHVWNFLLFRIDSRNWIIRCCSIALLDSTKDGNFSMRGTGFFLKTWLFTWTNINLGLSPCSFHMPGWGKILSQYGLSLCKRPPRIDILTYTWVVAYGTLYISACKKKMLMCINQENSGETVLFCFELYTEP